MVSRRESTERSGQSTSSIKQKILGATTGVALGLASLLGGARADAGVINVNPSQNVATINSTIDSSSPGDTINFQAGTYNQGLGEYYSFLGNRDYTLEDGIIIRGADPENGKIFQTSGSNIHITGNVTNPSLVRLENSEMIGIFGGTSFYESIYVSGLTSQTGGTIEAMHYEWKNRKSSVDVTAPSVYFSNMVLIGGTTGFHFSSLNQGTDGKSPYISTNHITADGLADILVDVPIRDDTSTLSDGQYYITNNALLNSNAVVTETLWPLFSTPSNLAQLNVTASYINAKKNCFKTDNMKFVSGSYVPQEDSPLNLGGGQYIGAYAPIPESSSLALLVTGAAAGGVAALARNRLRKRPED